MLIIADSSALVALAVCNGLEWLDRLFTEVKVPQAVFDEVTVKGKPEAEKLREYLNGKTASVDLGSVVVVTGGLGQGELEAMVLYKSLNADYLLIDDNRARKIARLNQITITGSQGILLLAKHNGLISQVGLYLDRLEQSDIRISKSLMKKIRELAGERQ